MTVMYDSTSPSAIPGDAQIVAGYVDGRYAWPQSGWDRFPDAQKVRIAVRASTNDGQVLDVEPGNDPPAMAPGWVEMRRAAGQARPTIYCAEDGHGDIGWTISGLVATFVRAGVSQPDYWLAHGTFRHGVVAIQTGFFNSYDMSETDGFWPGPIAELPTEVQCLLLT